MFQFFGNPFDFWKGLKIKFMGFTLLSLINIKKIAGYWEENLHHDYLNHRTGKGLNTITYPSI